MSHMFDTPSRVNLRGQRRPPTLNAPSVGSLPGSHSSSSGSSYGAGSSGSIIGGPNLPPSPGFGSPPLPQTPQQSLLRRPQSMQTLSTVRSSVRLGGPRLGTPSAMAGEAYRGLIHVGVRTKPSDSNTAWLVDPLRNRVEHDSAGDFQFDKVYDGSTSNADVFDRSVEPIVRQVVDGFNGTVFAYGATGSGKTYTMQGLPRDAGVTPRSVRLLFNLLEERGQPASVRLSYFEIYNERIFDLLASGTDSVEVKLRDASQLGPVTPGPAGSTGNFGNVGSSISTIVGQQELDVHNAQELLNLVASGDQFRRTHATQFNEHSSRSHAVVRILVTTRTSQSVLYLCDLAGSERAVQDSERRKEGSFINKSLLTLSSVISILSQGGGGHVPYRDSKLTRLLQPSLSGTALVAVLCTIQLGASASSTETLNTLRFAAKAKNVTVTARRNSVFDEPNAGPSQARVIEQYQLEVERLRRALTRTAAERDDLQDKLSILETPGVDVSAERSLEDLTGISFDDTHGDVTDRRRANDDMSLVSLAGARDAVAQDSELPAAEANRLLRAEMATNLVLKKQNAELVSALESLREDVTKLETDSEVSSKQPSPETLTPQLTDSHFVKGANGDADSVISDLRDQILQSNEIIRLLTGIRDKKNGLENITCATPNQKRMITEEDLRDLQIR